LNGQLTGEIGLNAAVCGQFGAPVLMISGDKTACAEACSMLGQVETAVVKTASGRMAAELLPPAMTQELIQSAAQRGVDRLKQGAAPQPYRPSAPITIAVDFVQSEMADKAANLPGTQRCERRVEYTAPDMVTIYDAFRALVALARG
jgi:D-amino peptidase